MTTDLNERLLKYFGGIPRNDLNQIIEKSHSEKNVDNEFSIEFYSPYKLFERIPEYFANQNNQLCVLTLNCQSLNEKFDKIKALLHFFKEKKFTIHALCFQETWIKGTEPDFSQFVFPDHESPNL